MDSVYFVCVYFVDTPLQDVDGLCLDFCMCLLCGYAAVGCGWTLSRPWSSALSSSSFGWRGFVDEAFELVNSFYRRTSCSDLPSIRWKHYMDSRNIAMKSIV